MSFHLLDLLVSTELFQKKIQTEGIEDMEFSGLLKKYHVKELKFLGVIKKNVGYYVEFPGGLPPWFLTLEFPKCAVETFIWNFQG